MENTRDSCNGEMPVTNMNMTTNTNCESDIHDEIISTGTKELTIDDEKAVDKGKFLGILKQALLFKYHILNLCILHFMAEVDELAFLGKELDNKTFCEKIKYIGKEWIDVWDEMKGFGWKDGAKKREQIFFFFWLLR